MPVLASRMSWLFLCTASLPLFGATSMCATSTVPSASHDAGSGDAAPALVDARSVGLAERDDPDAATRGSDAATASDGASRVCGTPPGPYGSRVGERFPGFRLPTCADSVFDFYGDTYCSASATVLSIAAAWCPRCQRESEHLEAEITQAYAARGVRVIQVLVQDEQFRPGSSAVCSRWVSTYGLTNPVLYDSGTSLASFYSTSSLPSTVMIDRDGVIRFRNQVSGAQTLTRQIDELLRAP